jgi:hypothetical protein
MRKSVAAKISPSNLMTFAVDNQLKGAIDTLAELTNLPDLYHAVISNDPDLVKAHLYGGQSPNKMYNGIPLLCHAVALERIWYINIVRTLVRGGANCHLDTKSIGERIAKNLRPGDAPIAVRLREIRPIYPYFYSTFFSV